VVPWYQYFIKGKNILKTFIDDFFRKILLYTMKSKFGVLDKRKME
jgi:hypothetical protein